MEAKGFYPSARRARRGIVVPFLRRRLHRRRAQPFGYYTNMVQQIEFIIHTNIQPLLAIFLPKVKVIGQRLKKMVVETITNYWKNNSWISHEVTHEHGDDLIRLSAFHR